MSLKNNSPQLGLYDGYHARRKLQKRILTKNNFTYRHLISVIDKNLKGIDNAIDIGCGTGALDFYLANKGITVTGIDISNNAIANARLNAKHLGLDSKTKFVVSEFPKNKLKNKFNLAICTELLEHIPDDRLAVKTINRILEPGAIAIFSTPSQNSPLYKLGIAKLHDSRVGHLRRYSSYKIKKLLGEEKFKILEVINNQGVFREILFTTSIMGFVIKIANKLSFVSNIITFIDNSLLFLGESDIIIVAQKI